MLLMIDNFDSFTFNIVQYLAELGADVHVERNNALTLEQIEAMNPSHLVISPGPCTPNEAGISVAAIQHFAGKLPILGVCLGHQAIAQAFGGKIVRAPQVMHGKTSLVEHQNTGIFNGLENPLLVTRYHSLVVEEVSLPACLEVTSRVVADDPTPGLIMGIKHKTLAVEGVQFHPESIMSHQGHQLLKNFLEKKNGYEASH